MLNPLSIQLNPPEPRSTSVPPGISIAPQEAAATSEVEAAKFHANPKYRLDPIVGLLMIEFHDALGEVTNTIPSQRQLDAYRTYP